MHRFLANMQIKRMMKSWGRRAAAAFLGMSLFVSSVAQAMPEIMSFDEMQEGMTGTGYTVIDSSGEIVPFGVEVLGVLKGGKGISRSIIAKASGAVIDSSGGIVHGMSGSPIYIDGKLVGAAAATFKEMNPTTFVITPVEDMLAIWDYPDLKKPKKPAGIDLKKEAEEKEKRLKKEAEKEAKKKAKLHENVAEDKKAETDVKPETQEKVKEDEPAKAAEKVPEKEKEEETVKKEPPKKSGNPFATEGLPSAGREPELKSMYKRLAYSEPQANIATRADKGVMFAAGFDALGYEYMSDGLRKLGYRTVPFGGFETSSEGNTLYNAQLEPGSSFGVAVAHGDFVVGGMGTVTVVDGNRILGFGHPMLGRGNVSYFLTDSDIIGTVAGTTDGMKIGNVKKVIGRVNQDRAAGVAGIVGEYPSVVGVRVVVNDNTLGKKQSYGTTVAYDEDFLPLLTSGIVYSALNKTMDSAAASTVKVHFDIITDALKGEKLERTNMFYAPGDVGKLAITELSEIMQLLCSNVDKETDIYDIKVDINSEMERKTAVIESAVPDRPSVRPGDTVIFKTMIKPYRGAKVKLDIPFTVPKNRREGKYTLDMHGGGLVALPLLAAEGMNLVMPDAPIETTDEKLGKVLERHMNNEIIIEPGVSLQLMSEKEQKQAIKEAIELSEKIEKGEEVPEPPISIFATDYIIENVIRATVNVDKNAPLPEKEEVPEEKKMDILDGNNLKLGGKTDIQAVAKELVNGNKEKAEETVNTPAEKSEQEKEKTEVKDKGEEKPIAGEEKTTAPEPKKE